MDKGIVHGFGAYFLWGLLPVYWKLLGHVLPLEVLVHRMLWSLVFVLLVLAARRQWQWIKIVRQRPRYVLIFIVTALLISLNWLTYIWAVNNDFILEASLGYFINPLINVLLGVLFLKERLRPAQTAAIILAAFGVIYLTLSYGAFPWIALILAFSFGFYGLSRKIASLGAIEGLAVETGVLLLPALAVMLYFEKSGQAAFLHGASSTSVLLIFSGAITAVPLLLFSISARRITLVALGILQYIAPTLQFVIGILLYGEPFSRTRFIGFCIIWSALIIFTIESLMQSRRAAVLK
ncbi:EamA family transporter RarD [candidate division KSB1 bacterium]|nr:EamA family transporter RarD [candidate division KSB1 bacterium]RQW06763.1 MAG: EamA family transporter RarD [candidate division KSB1 bacterium]